MGQYNQLIAQLDKDTRFLRDNKLIDYSLLLGVYEKPPDLGILKKNRDTQKKDVQTPMVYTSADGKKVYYLCIIDFLTSFTWIKKKAEYLVKRTFQGRDISCVPPEQYSTRFFKFISDSIENKGDSENSPQAKISKSRGPRFMAE